MKIILLSLMFVASITAGLLLINYVKPLLDSESAISIPVTELPATVKEQQQDREDDKTAEHAITAKNKDIEALKSKTDPVQASAAPKEADSKPVKVPGKIEPSKETAAQSSVPAKEETQKKIIPEKVRSTVPGKKINAARRDALLYNARRHEMNNNYAGALSSYKKALNLDRNNIAIINNIAYMYLQLDLIEDATTFSGNALKMNMDHVPSLINFAIAQARSGNYTDAYSYLDRAIKLEPDNNSVILNLAILNERQGNNSIAFEYYSQLSNLGNTEGLLGKARIYDKTGKIKEGPYALQTGTFFYYAE